MKGKVALITGGAGSIGLATAELFLREGARVMLVDLHAADLAGAASTIADVTNPEQVRAAVEHTVATFGKIDVLVSNAGTMGAIGPIEDYPIDAFDEVIAVHVKGAFLTCRFAVPHMNDGGSIIITSSVVGVRGAPGPYGYITAKHAQVGLMRSLAKQLAPRRIRVNTIHPGPVDNAFQLGIEQRLSEIMGRDATAALNAQIPLGRHAQPAEIAQSMLYLASDASSFTTATTLMADGGMSA